MRETDRQTEKKPTRKRARDGGGAVRERIEEELSFLTTLELGVSIEKVKGKKGLESRTGALSLQSYQFEFIQ